MTGHLPVLVRCERCRAVISSAEAKRIIRHGVPCGVCGGTLALCGDRGHRAEHRSEAAPEPAPMGADRRLLGGLRGDEPAVVKPAAGYRLRRSA